jgi:hypothetical protein
LLGSLVTAQLSVSTFESGFLRSNELTRKGFDVLGG